MSVSVRVNFSTTPLDDFAAYVEQIENNAREVAESVLDEIRQPFLDELQFYPPVPAGSRYKRTFRLKQGWVLEVNVINGGVQLRVSNRTPYTPWVVGSLAQDLNSAGRFQRDFHKRNGWPLAKNTVDFWIEAFTELFDQRFGDDLGEFAETTTNRRAATRL